MSTQHIINNDNLLLTECGQPVLCADESEAGPFYTAGGEVVIWDEQYTPATCAACESAYLTKYAA